MGYTGGWDGAHILQSKSWIGNSSDSRALSEWHTKPKMVKMPRLMHSVVS